MIVEGTQPGVQLYTGNFLPGDVGKGSVKYAKQTAFCLETQVNILLPLMFYKKTSTFRTRLIDQNSRARCSKPEKNTSILRNSHFLAKLLQKHIMNKDFYSRIIT